MAVDHLHIQGIGRAKDLHTRLRDLTGWGEGGKCTIGQRLVEFSIRSGNDDCFPMELPDPSLKASGHPNPLLSVGVPIKGPACSPPSPHGFFLGFPFPSSSPKFSTTPPPPPPSKASGSVLQAFPKKSPNHRPCPLELPARLLWFLPCRRPGSWYRLPRSLCFVVAPIASFSGPGSRDTCASGPDLGQTCLHSLGLVAVLLLLWSGVRTRYGACCCLGSQTVAEGAVAASAAFCSHAGSNIHDSIEHGCFGRDLVPVVSLSVLRSCPHAFAPDRTCLAWLLSATAHACNCCDSNRSQYERNTSFRYLVNVAS